MNQLRTSRTDYDSTTNPNIYQFVAICGICGLCGTGALGELAPLTFRRPFRRLPFLAGNYIDIWCCHIQIDLRVISATIQR